MPTMIAERTAANDDSSCPHLMLGRDGRVVFEENIIHSTSSHHGTRNKGLSQVVPIVGSISSPLLLEKRF